MGISNLPKLPDAPVIVDALTEQYNAVVDALQGHLILRDSDGVIEDNVSDIGRPASGRPRKLYLGTGLNVAGQDIDFSVIALAQTGISSGKANVSGFPNFLSPEGATGGTFNRVIIEAATTNLEFTIEGTAYSLEIDLASDDLVLASNSNNTALIIVDGSGDSRTKSIGEFGQMITLSNIGSEISDLDDWEIQPYKIGNEVFLAYHLNEAGTHYLQPIKRGICGTDRSILTNGDTCTLLRAHYIFLDNDLATVDTTSNYPVISFYEPTAPVSGDYWLSLSDNKWYRYSGATYEALTRIYLGFAICDSTDCLYAECEDFNLNWNDALQYELLAKKRGTTHTVAIKGPLYVSVAGTMLRINNNVFIDLNDSTLREDAFSTAQNTWVYLYVDKYGEFTFSLIAPRKKNYRHGWYHPEQYWRCIGVFYLNGDNTGEEDQIYVGYLPESGKLDLFGWQVGWLANASGNTMVCDCPEILSDINLNATAMVNGDLKYNGAVELSNGGNTSDFYEAFEAGVSGVIPSSYKPNVMITLQGNLDDDQVSIPCNFPYIRNKTFYANIAGGNLKRVTFYQLDGMIKF